MKEMLKKNKGKMILSSIIILLPGLVGAILWNRLPEVMPTHWGIDGKANGWSSPLFAVLLLPVLLLLLHWVAVLITWWDNAKTEQSPKVLGLVYWIMPAISLYVSAIMYAAAFGFTVHMHMLILILLGVTFILIGNYLPKCRQNRTIGMKIKWTLANEENWNKTHRVAGIVSVAVGIGCLIAAFLPAAVFPAVLVVLIVACVGIPTVYSYLLYKKQIREGRAEKSDFKMSKKDKRIGAVVTAVIVLILAFCLVICFTGDIEMSLGEDSFTVVASYYEDITVSYADIERLEYRAGGVDGTRVMGFGSPRLLMGAFENDEFGNYTRYTYARPDACVVLSVKGKILVLGCADDAATEAFYNALTVKTEKAGE